MQSKRKSPYYDFHVSVPANSPQTSKRFHCTMFYLKGVTDKEIKMAKKLYVDILNKYVVPDANGRYILAWTYRNPWGQKSDILGGPLAEFHARVQKTMSDAFPRKLRARPCHVDVKGDHTVPLYHSFNVAQIEYHQIIKK